MEIPYYLVDNPLTPDPKDFRTQLQLKGTKRQIDIVKRMMIKHSGLAESEQGIYFVKEDETKTRVEEYTEIGDKKIIFNIPQRLTAGNYTLCVNGKTTAGELREGKLLAVLKVA